MTKDTDLTTSQKIITFIWVATLVIGCFVMVFVPDEVIVFVGAIFFCVMLVLTVILYSSIYGTDWLTKEI